MRPISSPAGQGWQCLQYTHVPFVSFGVREAMTGIVPLLRFQIKQIAQNAVPLIILQIAGLIQTVHEAKADVLHRVLSADGGSEADHADLLVPMRQLPVFHNVHLINFIVRRQVRSDSG